MDKILVQLGASGTTIAIVLWIVLIAEAIKVGKIIWDFFAPKILGIQTTVSKEKKYRKQVEDNNIKLNEYLDTQNEINKTTEESLKQIVNKIDTLTDDVAELKIEEMRQKILDFASALNAGRIYTKEQYNFILKLYNTYEDFIERTGRTNDEVEISMEIIRSYYEYCIKNHCFVEDKLNDARIQSMLNNIDNKSNETILPEKKTKRKTSSGTRKKSTTKKEDINTKE